MDEPQIRELASSLVTASQLVWLLSANLGAAAGLIAAVLAKSPRRAMFYGSLAGLAAYVTCRGYAGDFPLDWVPGQSASRTVAIPLLFVAGATGLGALLKLLWIGGRVPILAKGFVVAAVLMVGFWGIGTASRFIPTVATKRRVEAAFDVAAETKATTERVSRERIQQVAPTPDSRVYGAEDCEYTVTFPAAPESRSVSAMAGNRWVEREEAQLTSDRTFLRAVCVPVRMSGGEAFELLARMAASDGMRNAGISDVGVNVSELRGYKTIDGETAIYIGRVYRGSNSTLMLSVGARSADYPTVDSSNFFDSVKGIASR